MRKFKLVLAALLLMASCAHAQRGTFVAQNIPAHRWVRIAWTANAGGDSVTGYHVYRSAVAGGPYTRLTATPIPLLFYRDDLPSQGATFYYVITAINATGEGTTSAEIVEPVGPGIGLSWSANIVGDNVTGYNVYRSTVNGGPYTKINSSPVTVLLYRDYAVTAGTTYYYTLTAANAAGEGTASVQVSGTPR